MRHLFRFFLLSAILVVPLGAFAGDAGETLAALQHDWAIANYEKHGDAQQAAFEALIRDAEAATAANPASAGLWIWDGIIRSTYAGVKGGLGALSLAKQSRASLEKAMEIDADALDGSAYTSLGTLYFKVPGWPVGFGNDKKARQMLEKALEINPDGIDPNYFYADYLIDKKNYAAAEQYLLKAQQATPRAGRELADAGRQAEIRTALEGVRDKLGRAES